MKICNKPKNKQTNAFLSMLLFILLTSLFRCGQVSAEDLLLYPSAGAFYDEKVSFPGDMRNTLTGMINNPNDIGMVMYTKPSFSGETVRTVMNSTPVTITSEQTAAEGYRWVRVKTQDGYEGWVFATGIVDMGGKPLLPAIDHGTQPYSGSSSGFLGSTVNNYSEKPVQNYVVSPNTGSSSGRTVWIHTSGERYHSNAKCSGGAEYEVSIEYAEGQGLTPCKKCYR